MILSVPEGDDKPLKYPLMFSICDVLLVNKIDVAPYFNFDLDKCVERVKKLNPNIQVFPISALKGEGIEPWPTGCVSRRRPGRIKRRKQKPGIRSRSAPPVFYTVQALHTGRTYLKNRAQSW